jgi:flagellar protein FlaF
MSAAAHAQSSYAHPARPLKTPRDIEYDLMAGITGRLTAALPPTRGRLNPSLVAALHDNSRMWAAFATDLANPGNAFPSDLRANLFALAEFTLKHSAKVLRDEATADVLIEINTAVMRGLRGSRGRP